MKIYIVIGTTGEYSDRFEWIVKAYSCEDKAKEHVTNATNKANEIFKTIEDSNESFWGNELIVSEYDEHIKMDYTGTKYSYAETILES